MAISNVNIDIKDKPLNKNQVDELINYSGYDIHLILRYEKKEEGKGFFLIYAMYYKNHKTQVIRQVYTQRKTPRQFRSVQRAISWGKRVGFKSVTLIIDYSIYQDSDLTR